MNEITRIAIDTSKSVFTLHGTDAGGRAVLRRNLRRQEIVPFFDRRPPIEVVLEACGGSPHWGTCAGRARPQGAADPAAYVKPFVKRGKNDRNDAEAISEAAARPDMRAVAVKSADQQAKGEGDAAVGARAPGAWCANARSSSTRCADTRPAMSAASVAKAWQSCWPM